MAFQYGFVWYIVLAMIRPRHCMQESPIFDFLNSLSPVKPVKSIHVTQTINPFTFTSLPSIFTSPYVGSLSKSRFLRW